MALGGDDTKEEVRDLLNQSDISIIGAKVLNGKASLIPLILTQLIISSGSSSRPPCNTQDAPNREDQAGDQEVIVHGFSQDEDGVEGDGQRDCKRDQQRDHEDEVVEEPSRRAAEA